VQGNPFPAYVLKFDGIRDRLRLTYQTSNESGQMRLALPYLFIALFLGLAVSTVMTSHVFV